MFAAVHRRAWFRSTRNEPSGRYFRDIRTAARKWPPGVVSGGRPPWGWRELNLLRLVAIDCDDCVCVLAGCRGAWLAVIPAASWGWSFTSFAIRTAAQCPPHPRFDRLAGRWHSRRGDAPGSLRVPGTAPPFGSGSFCRSSTCTSIVLRWPARVLAMQYHPGEFLNVPAGRKRNCVTSRCGSVLRSWRPPVDRFAVRQIPGRSPGGSSASCGSVSRLRRGEKFGMIKLGSRTELILPAADVRSRRPARGDQRPGRQSKSSPIGSHGV